MTCSDVEILLAEYVDGILRYEVRSAVETHLASCAACRELAGDASSAVAFLERVPSVEAPPELTTRILFEISNGPSRAMLRPSLVKRVFGRILGGWLEPLWQPRFAMGMATTALFFGALIHVDPAHAWTAAQNRLDRTWERSVKYYENMRLVFEIQARLDEWANQTPAPAQQKRENQ